MNTAPHIQTPNRRLFLGANALALLLSEAHVKAATGSQDDHKQHNDAPIGTIRKLRDKPVDARTPDEYNKELKVDRLRNEDDVLDLAARLELGATNAYLGVITAFKEFAGT